MKHLRIALQDLRDGDQHRKLIPEAVNKLAQSINEVGLIQAIAVRPITICGGTARTGYQIVSGHHRAAACRKLDMTEIDAMVLDADELLNAELIEIDENLCRAELTVAQKTMYTKQRQQIWNALHQDIQVGQLVPPEIGYKKPPKQSQAFAANTAAATGTSKRDINRRIARADALGDAVSRVVGTSLDSGVELDALASLPAAQREELIAHAEAGGTVSARDVISDAIPVKVSNPAQLSIDIKNALRKVLDGAGCLSVAELGKQVLHMAELVPGDIGVLNEIAEYLQEWATQLRVD